MKFRHQIVLIVFVAIITTIPNQSFSQTEYGVKAGASYSSFKNENSGFIFDYEYASGILLGGYLKKENIIGPISLQAEFLYQTKGSKTYVQYLPENGSGYFTPYYFSPSAAPWRRYTEKYHYFSVPILFAYSPHKLFEIYAGPEFGYMFAFGKDGFYKHGHNRFSVGLATGFNVKLGPDTKLDFRYSTDFTKLYDTKYVDNLKNQSFSILVQQTLFRK